VANLSANGVGLLRAAATIALLLSASCGDESGKELERLRSENAELKASASDPNSYVCKVTAASELGDDGVLANGNANIKGQTVGKTFVVDKHTGLISGAVGNNITYESRDVVFTPPNNPFYVVSTSHGPNRNLEFLTIRDWVDGVEKPFMLVGSSLVFTGKCR
jgi:hypothetical protein